MPTRRTMLAASGLGFLGFGARAWSASEPFPASLQAAMTALRKEGRYLPFWRLAKAEHPPGLSDFLKQMSAAVGDERFALSGRTGGAPVPDLTHAIAEPALRAIVKAAAGRRVVMLNEAHTASRHRLFLAQVLRVLRKEGFTHLAAETFANGPGDATRIEALRAGQRVGSNTAPISPIRSSPRPFGRRSIWATGWRPMNSAPTRSAQRRR